MPRVVIVMDQEGTFEVLTDEPCEVVIVNNHCPNDRLYRLTSAHTVGRDAVDEALGNDIIGSADDDRHEAIRNRILSAERGEKHLKPVE